MYKLDLEPLSPKLRKNKEARVDYLKKAKEDADTLRDIVEQARAQQPLHSALEYACKFTTWIQELLVYVSATCPSPLNKNEKSVASTTMNKSKKVGFEEPRKSTNDTTKEADSRNSKITNPPLLNSTGVKSAQNRVSECNASTKQDVLKENSKSVYKTCNECLFNACHDLYVVDYLNNVNVRAKSRSKSNKKKVWKPTSKVFTNFGHRWIPTGRTFTIDGNKCPLTRITSTTVVSPKKPVTAKV
ncbi:hypothetical protein Tco_1331362 [Tanacetum coccineum]